MTRCPSQDWDDYANFEEECAETERRMIYAHADRIATIAAGILANPSLVTNDSDIGRFAPSLPASEVIDFAVEIVSNLHGRGCNHDGEWQP